MSRGIEAWRRRDAGGKIYEDRVDRRLKVRPLGDNRLMRLCYCSKAAGMGLMSWLC